MAQLVGDAYVRIFADTHALRRAIDRDVKKIGADAGDGLAQSLLTNFGKTIEKQADARLRRYQITLADSIAGGDFNRMLRQSGKGIDEFVASIRADLESFERRGYFKKVAGNAYDFRQALESLENWAKQSKLAEQIKETERSSKQLERAVLDQNRAWATYGRNLIATQQRLDNHEIRMRRYANTIDRTVILLRRHSVATGRMFGAGSRSELLNFIGRLMGGLASIPAIAGGAFSSVFNGVTGVIEKFRDLRNAGSGVFESIATIAGGLMAKLVPALASALVGIVAMTQLLPVVITLFAHLAGAAVAVAGAIGTALLGGLLALLPLLPAVGVGVGAIALGIAGLADQSDKLKRRMAPVIDAFKDLKAALGNEFMGALSRNAKGFADIIRDWTPMFRDVTRQIGFMIDRFTGLLRHPAMKPFIDAWQKSIPKILGSLGDGLVSLGAALTAFFKPILPFAERLAAAFDRAMRTFLDWSTSAGGQNSIADFMERAWDMGGRLWTVLKNVGSILGSILTAGAEGPGKDFLTWLGDITTKWAEFLDSEEGQKAMKTFFEDVRDTMVTIKDAFGELISGLKSADWEQAKTDLGTLLDAASAVATAIRFVFGSVDEAVRNTRQQFGLVGNPFEDLPGMIELSGRLTFEKIEFVIGGIIGAMQGFGERVNETLSTIFLSIPSKIAGWLAGVNPTLLAAFLNPIPGLLMAGNMIVSAVSGFMGRIPGAIAVALLSVGARIIAPFQNVIPTLQAVLGSMVVTTGSFLGRIPGVIGAVLVSVGVSIVAPFRGALGPLQAALGNLNNNVRAIVSRIPGIIGGLLVTVVNRFTSPFTSAIGAVAGAIGGIVNRVRGAVGGIPGAVTGALAGLALRFTQPFASAFGGISDWIARIKGLVSSAVSWLSSIDLNPFSAPGPPAPPGGPGFGGPGPRGGPGGGPMGAGSDPFGINRLNALTQKIGSTTVKEVQTGPKVLVNFEEGSIRVESRASDPVIVAQQVVDRIAAAIPA